MLVVMDPMDRSEGGRGRERKRDWPKVGASESEIRAVDGAATTERSLAMVSKKAER